MNKNYDFSLYAYKGDGYPIYWLTQKQWDEEMENWRSKKPYPLWFMKKFVRGFRRGEYIYIKQGTKFGLERLILHEIGHILGYKHTWKPNLMFRSWIGRWFKRFPKSD